MKNIGLILSVLLAKSSLTASQGSPPPPYNVDTLDVSNGNSPTVNEPFECAPPEVSVTADSSGVHLAVTSYFETTDDASNKTHGVAGRTTFAGATFDPNPSSGIMSYDGQSFFDDSTDLYSGSALMYNPSGSQFHQQSYGGVCDNHHILEPGGVPKLDVFGIFGTNSDKINNACGGANMPSGQWSIQTTYDGSSYGNGKCSGRRVASYSEVLNVFRAFDFVGDSDPNGGNTTLSWKITTVDMAEVGAADGTVLARFNTNSFTLDFSQTAAVTVSIDSGDVLPPAMIQVTGMNSAREETAGQATLTWTFDMYVRQGQELSQNFLFDLTNALGAPSLTVDDNAGWGSTTCNAIMFHCDTISGTECGRFGSDDLPSAILSSLTTYTQLNALEWRSYSASVQCTLASNAAEPSTADLVIPPSTLTFSYAISDSSYDGSGWSYDEVVTDTVTPPTLSFTTSTTLPADKSEIVELSITGSLINLNDLSSNPASLQEHVDDNQESKITSGSVAWSQAVGFQVALTDDTIEGDRKYWHLVPQFILITAHSTAAAGADVSDSYEYIHAGHLLPDTWCGVDNVAGTTIGAIVLSDEGSADGNFQPNIPAFEDYLSVSLKNKLTNLVTNNKIANDQMFNFAGLTSWSGWPEAQTSSYVVNATDGSYVVPMRNRLKLNSGVGGGFALRFCAITKMEPTAQARRHLSSSSAGRRMLSTQFTFDPRAKTASTEQQAQALPSTADLENFFFEAEPMAASTDASASATNGGIYLGVGLIFVGMIVIFMVFTYFYDPQPRRNRRVQNYYRRE